MLTCDSHTKSETVPEKGADTGNVWKLCVATIQIYACTDGQCDLRYECSVPSLTRASMYVGVYVSVYL